MILRLPSSYQSCFCSRATLWSSFPWTKRGIFPNKGWIPSPSCSLGPRCRTSRFWSSRRSSSPWPWPCRRIQSRCRFGSSLACSRRNRWPPGGPLRFRHNHLFQRRIEKPPSYEAKRLNSQWWCLARESNSHGFLRTILSRLRLPFRQLGTGSIIYNHGALFKTNIIANTLHEKDLWKLASFWWLFTL